MADVKWTCGVCGKEDCDDVDTLEYEVGIYGESIDMYLCKPCAEPLVRVIRELQVKCDERKKAKA